MKLYRMVLVLITVFIFCIFSYNIFAQPPSNLTDRELLIQLTVKVGFIEESVKRIENNSARANSKVDILEKQVAKNEINIAGFFDKIDDLTTRWNALLALFAGFMITIFVWMWRRTYNGPRPTKSK